MQKLNSIKHESLTEKVLKALAQSRVMTLLDFLQEDTERLSVICSLNISEVLSVRKHIFTNFSAPLLNGLTLLKSNSTKKNSISTGISSMDLILDGGIPMGCITEICGLADSGKTQLCLQLAINCVKNTDNTVLYIDTKGDFSAIRVQKILDAQGLSHKEMAVIMHKIKIIYVWNMEQLVELLQNIKNNTITFINLSLIIVDSLPCLMFQFLGDNNKIGLAFLNKFVNYCRFLCSEINISVICINLQTRWVDQDVSDLEDERDQDMLLLKETVYVEKHNRCLGNYWRCVPALQLLLEKTPSTECNNIYNIGVTSTSSYNRENKKCILKLNVMGITSV